MILAVRSPPNFVMRDTKIAVELPIGEETYPHTPRRGRKMGLKNFMEARGERHGQEDTGTARLPDPSEPPVRTIAPSTSIDSTSDLKGTLRCKETIRIDGRVKGEVECDKTVLIGEGGKVHASIVADIVQISGEVKGNITARSKITLERTASVIGDLSTPGIVIEEGAKLQGRIVIGSDENPVQESKSAEQPRMKAKPATQPQKAPKPAAPPPA
jgi:cytoskeletal protein CcmA (bactofilin family)